MATCTAYLQIEPEFWSTWDGRPRVHRIKPVRLTAKQPRDPLGGTITVKVNLDIDDAAFLPLEPEATVEIGAGDITVNVTVEEQEGDG